MSDRVLTDEQLADAKRLENIFLLKQEEAKSRGEKLSQEQVAFMCGWKTQANFNSYLKGRKPIGLEAAITMARALGVSVADISPTLAKAYGDNNQLILDQIRALDNVIIDYGDDDNSNDIKIAVHDVIFCCGDGNNADFGFEDVKGYRKFSSDFFKDKNIKPENFKLICASNDSQTPFINHGDIVGIDISDTEIRDGEMYAILLDGERMFKRIFREGGGVFRLHCYNPAYHDKIIDHTNGKSLKIVGRQVYRAG